MDNDLKTGGGAQVTPISRRFGAAARGLTAVCLVLLGGLVTYALLQSDFWLGASGDRQASFTLNLDDQLWIDPQLIDYQQTASLDLKIGQPRAIACGPGGKIYVAGDRAIHVFDADGKLQNVINFDSQPTCLVAGSLEQAQSGQLFVGMSDGIRILNDDHEIVATWPLPAENALLTSIAVSGEEIFVADAGNRLVWRLSATGELLGQIGKEDASRRIPGFIIPHPNFDIVAGSEGLLFCVNPGKLQVSTYSFAGDLGSSWGRAGSSIADFFGCCNPSHLARFDDGRFVTSEKGIPRIKVYTMAGELESVVAGPEQLGIREQSISDPRQGINELSFDIAVDGRGRVLVLDSRTRTVRIFETKQNQ